MRICCITQSALGLRQPRLMRTARSLHNAGHDVTTITLGEPLPAHDKDIPSVLVDQAPVNPPWLRILHAGQLLTVSATRRGASRLFSTFDANKRFRDAVIDTPADLYIARNWDALPAAAEAAQFHDSRYAYDSPELAGDQNMDSLRWRILHRRYVQEIESRYLPRAAFVTAVSEGIAQTLEDRYRLPRTPTVLRNMPSYTRMELKYPGEMVKVLYQGVFAPERGLENLIDSTSDWPADYVLHLRGFGSPAFETALRKRAQSVSVPERIHFLKPVSPTDMVRSASEADIGIFALQGTSLQRRFALPNKLFEYIMAGLALCVTDFPEMASIINTHNVGTLIETPSADGIAEAVHGLDRDAIIRCKQNSLDAAHVLCWEHEEQRLLNLVSALDQQ